MGKKRGEGDNEDEDEKGPIKRRRLEAFQIDGLETHFRKNIYPSTQEKEQMAIELELKPATVSKWFINRRVKLRSETEGKEKPKKSKGGADEEPSEQEQDDKNMKEKLKAKLTSRTNQDEEQGNNIKTSKSSAGKKSKDETKSGEGQKRKKTQKKDSEKPLTKEELQEEKAYWEKYKENNPIPSQEVEDDGNPFDVESENEIDSSTSSSSTIPLWKQLYIAHNKRPLPKKHKKLQQKMLRHIFRMRIDQNLPPFFALLTGPTIRPYRMEELSIFIGRNSFSHKEADISVGTDKHISHVHCRIYFDQENFCYCIENLSKNGIKVKINGKWEEFTKISSTTPLPNPATISIGDVEIYFQIFYINPANSKTIEILKRDVQSQVDNKKKVKNGESEKDSVTDSVTEPKIPQIQITEPIIQQD